MHRAVAVFALAAGCAASDGRADSAAAPAAATGAAPATAATGRPDAGAGADTTLLRRADADRILGDSAARVWVIVVSDFQCPYCAEWHATIAPVLRQQYVRTGRVRLAYLHYPLNQHRHAWPAAEVSMCAAAQGRFWPVHDAIFATQQRWAGMPAAVAAAFFDSLAVAAGAEPSRLRACVNAGTMKSLIQADYDRTRQAGVRSTPTIIVDQEIIPGVAPLEVYRAVLDSALVRAARNRD